MHIEVEKKDLIVLLSKTQNIVDKKNAMPILINVLLEAKNGILRVFATDLEISLVDECPVKIIKEGALVVSAKNLYEIVRELSDGTVQLLRKENNWVEIKQRKYTSKIVGINPDEYPIFPIYSGLGFIKIDSLSLREMIDKVIFSISNDETRYYLNGVYFEQLKNNEGSKFRMVATDGHRLSVIDKNTVETLNMADGSTGVIIPKKGIYEIKKLIEGADQEIEMAAEGTQLIIKIGSTNLMVRLVDGKYPNYHQLIPSKLNVRVKVDKETLLSSVKRVALLANQKSKGITFTLTNGKMEISSNNPELGDAKEELEIEYSGKDMKIGFNARYITDILSTISNINVTFEVNDQLSPLVLRPYDDNSYTCIVMPIRI